MLKLTRTLIVVGAFAMLPGANAAAQSKPNPAARPHPVIAGQQGETARAVPRPQQDAPSQDAAFVPDLNGAGATAVGQNGVHPAVGSWFGRAIQVCPQGVAPSACAFGLQAPALFMTPTLTADGIFLGNDTFSLEGPPFGPHTTAHGSWVATSSTEFTADYVFMVGTFPPVADHFVAVRFQWRAQVIDADTAVGYVNAWFMPEIPLKWTPLAANEFPSYPAEAAAALKPPTAFIKDPTLCSTDPCPLVFKFTIKRITQ